MKVQRPILREHASVLNSSAFPVCGISTKYSQPNCSTDPPPTTLLAKQLLQQLRRNLGNAHIRLHQRITDRQPGWTVL
jgi:hypothetical protein